ncbi:hypothetical protein [Rhizobium sp. Leaf311]|uniref:hypothetical protein n=1 Tax=Rhizobium sp. Leaf311 TaxID=1736332 RepID=UPI0009EAE4E9|nr:hypothetical protein [Rhizobium sp. Leaf311]
MTHPAIDRVLRLIENSTDSKALRQFAENARKKGEPTVAHAAELRLYEILPSEEPGSFEHDVWRSIHALEGTLTNERGKTTRLGRTRQKIARVGELGTVTDLIVGTKKPSEGFTMLLDRQMPELTFEAVALRHPDKFDQDALDVASQRLQAASSTQTR